MNVAATRNANSVSTASADGQSTAGQSPTGPLPISALAEALTSHFEGPGEEINQAQVQPAEAGQTAAEAGTTAAETEQLESQETGETAGDVLSQEEQGQESQAEGEAAESEAAGNTPGVKKRIDALLRQQRELETKLEATARELEQEQQRGPQRGPGPLDNVFDSAELARRQDKAEKALEEVDTLLSKLSVAPNKVEKALREMGVVLKTDDGDEDFSVERMADTLTAAKADMKRTLRAIPKRREYLANYQKAHEQAVKQFPWMADKTDERTALMQNIAGQFPGFKQAVNWEYWTGCAIEGHQLKQRQAQAKPAAAGGKKVIPKSGAAAQATAPKAGTPEANMAAARARVEKERSRDSLAGFFEATGFAGQ